MRGTLKAVVYDTRYIQSIAVGSQRRLRRVHTARSNHSYHHEPPMQPRCKQGPGEVKIDDDARACERS